MSIKIGKFKVQGVPINFPASFTSVSFADTNSFWNKSCSAFYAVSACSNEKTIEI